MPELPDLLAELASGDDARAEGAIPALVSLGAAAIPALVEMSRAAAEDARWWAVRALAASSHTDPAEFVPLLDDPSTDVRAAAALAIVNHPHESAVPALLRLLGDADSLTATLAGNALTAVGGPAVDGLVQVLGRASATVRIQALRSLAGIGDSRAIPVMMAALSEESAVLQYWAQEGLDRLGLDMVYLKP